MTEQVEGQEGQSTETEQVDVNPVEQEAIGRGWKPKEEYSGDPARWRSAEVFLALDEPLKRIEHQSKEMKQLRAALDAFKEHHTKVESVAFDRALKSLQEERKQAMIDQDIDKTFALEAQMEEVKEQKRELAKVQATPAVPAPAPEFVEWQNKNSWYNSNRAMTAAADALGKDLHAQGYSPAQVLKKVEEQIREEFPHKFTNPKASRPNAVEGEARGGGRVAADNLSQEEVDIMRKIVKSGVMTEAQYKAELKKIKEL